MYLWRKKFVQMYMLACRCRHLFLSSHLQIWILFSMWFDLTISAFKYLDNYSVLGIARPQPRNTHSIYVFQVFFFTLIHLYIHRYIHMTPLFYFDILLWVPLNKSNNLNISSFLHLFYLHQFFQKYTVISYNINSTT